jgi:hypothetical protein
MSDKRQLGQSLFFIFNNLIILESQSIYQASSAEPDTADLSVIDFL